MQVAVRMFWIQTLFASILALTGCAGKGQPTEAGKLQPSFEENQLRSRVEVLLSQSNVGSVGEWKQLGPGALPILEQIYRDPTSPESRRFGAVESLAQVDNPEASTALKGILSDARMPPPYRARAARALGLRDGRSAVQSLRPVLGDSDPLVREAAIKSVADVGGDEARKFLEERLPREEDPNLRAFIQRTLVRIQP